MKNFAILLLTFLLSFTSFADAWDNLTRQEAEEVVAYLEAHPFIFEYCDCCDYDGEYATMIHMVKVVSTEIIPCSWNDGQFSVKYTSEPIIQIDYTKEGPNLSELNVAVEADANAVIYMNYTWGINIETGLAEPIFNSVQYDYYGEASPCKTPFSYPTPRMLKKVAKVKGYKKWYKKNVL